MAFAAKGQAVGIVPVGTELCLQVGVVVLQDEVVVRPVPGSAVQEGGEQLPLLVVGGNGAVYQGIDGPAQAGMAFSSSTEAPKI